MKTDRAWLAALLLPGAAVFIAFFLIPLVRLFLIGGSGPPINLYVAWYDSQRAGRSTHSPRTCLPSGGWQVDSFTQLTLPSARSHGNPLRANRVLISLRGDRQLVYYWFSQRGRIVTNEYAVKWWLFWDSLTRNRSDGALIRLTLPLAPGEQVEAADARMAAFAAQVAPQLDPFLPD